MSSESDDSFGFRHGIAVAQLVCFAPAIFYAYFFRNSGCIGYSFVGVFSILRVVGASIRLASINSDSSSLDITTFVCESLGIILLTFLYLEFLERMYVLNPASKALNLSVFLPSLHSNQTIPLLNKWYFRAVSLLMLLDIGLSIGGYVTMTRRTENVLIPTGWIIAGSAIVAFVYCYTVGLFAFFWLSQSRHSFGPEERRLLLAPAILTFPLLVRHIHLLIFVGTSDLFWNQVVGNGFAYLSMIMMPEVTIIAVAIWCIRGVKPLSKDPKNVAEEHGKLGSSASHGQMLLGQKAPQESHQLRRRQTP